MLGRWQSPPHRQTTCCHAPNWQVLGLQPWPLLLAGWFLFGEQNFTSRSKFIPKASSAHLCICFLQYWIWSPLFLDQLLDCTESTKEVDQYKAYWLLCKLLEHTSLGTVLSLWMSCRKERRRRKTDFNVPWHLLEPLPSHVPSHQLLSVRFYNENSHVNINS